MAIHMRVEGITEGNGFRPVLSKTSNHLTTGCGHHLVFYVQKNLICECCL